MYFRDRGRLSRRQISAQGTVEGAPFRGQHLSLMLGLQGVVMGASGESGLTSRAAPLATRRMYGSSHALSFPF